MALRVVLLPLISTVLGGVLDQDDECLAEGGCGLSALQTRALQTANDSDEERGWAVDLDFDFQDFVTEAEPKEYTNISLQDLGSDELMRLAAAAETELATRAAAATGSASDETLGAAPEAAAEGAGTLEEPWASRDPGHGPVPLAKSMGAANASQKVAVDADSAACVMQEYSGNRHTELCFCQLAGNRGCSSQQCACPQGCGNDVTWDSGSTVTFKNRARAHGCHPSTVLLTVPQAYFATPRDLKECGGRGMQVIEAMLRDSWNVYQKNVARGSMHQCFHGSRTASVKYVHLQSFCSYASFHAMPNHDHSVGCCVTMRRLSDASRLARQLFHMMQ